MPNWTNDDEYDNQYDEDTSQEDREYWKNREREEDREDRELEKKDVQREVDYFGSF